MGVVRFGEWAGLLRRSLNGGVTMIERRFTELRAADGDCPEVTGILMRYGAVAKLPGFRERFLPGAFGPVGDIDAICNLQHERSRPVARTGGGGLILEDSPVEIRAVLRGYAKTGDSTDMVSLIRAKVLTGLSVEFTVLPGGDTFAGNLRTVKRATLSAVAVVDRAAYDASSVLEVAKRAVGEERGAVMLAAMIESALFRAPNRDALLAALASILDVPLGNLQAAAEPDVGGLRGEDLPAWLLS